MRIPRMVKWALTVSIFLVCSTSMLNKPIIFAGAPNEGSDSTASSPIQLFDIKAQRIVKTFPNNKEFQATAAQWIKSITGPSPQLTIGHQCGYIVRIPLTSPADVVLPRETVQVKDVFLIYCPEKEPLLLVFSKERKPYLLRINIDVKPFIQQLLTTEPTGKAEKSSG
ncbi:type IV secretion system protein VirB6 [Paenibacillus alvei]|uniref:type IV secretion system protein VirB6 n=1 Tax=Paenibacillus alvei TaxID=44250 RepID=UPI00227DD6F8|nr:type IV secretion system protein VirB6 [Paenibacillus alvei]MCY7485552.1 type IV secretion system protein VirB6 [Paenibacillus alvei]